MGRWAEGVGKVDGFLGRLVFRAFGLLFALIALGCGYATIWHATHWDADYSLGPLLMFGLITIATASVVPYCFSRKRSLVEALDAMEGGNGLDTNRRR